MYKNTVFKINRVKWIFGDFCPPGSQLLSYLRKILEMGVTVLLPVPKCKETTDLSFVNWMLLPGTLNLEVLWQRHGSEHGVVRYGGSDERGYMMLLDSWDKYPELGLCVSQFGILVQIIPVISFSWNITVSFMGGMRIQVFLFVKEFELFSTP